MAISQTDRNKRRALIVRRQAALRRSRTQRELWRKRREEQGLGDDEFAGEDDLMVDLHDRLIG